MQVQTSINMKSLLKGFFILLFLSSFVSYAQPGTSVTNPIVVNSFPYTETNFNSSGGVYATGMLGGCSAVGCCSVLVYKVTIPANGALRMELSNSSPLSTSILAYKATTTNPAAFSDLSFISATSGNFCGFRDSLMLGRAYYWNNTPYGQTPVPTGLTNLYDFNSPSSSAGFFPAGDYYVLVFNENQQASLGVGTTSDLTFEFAEACSKLTTPSTLPFASVEFNSASDTIDFYVKNDRQLAVIIDTSNVSITGTDASQFSILSYPDTNLANGDSTLMQVVFTPTSGGSKTATLDIPFADTVCSTSNTISLTGTGAESEIKLLGNSATITYNDLTPSVSNFTDMGAIVTHTGSLIKEYFITNTGADTLEITGTVTLNGNAQFVVINQPASTVLSGDSTSFKIEFTPTTDGLAFTDVSIVNNDAAQSPFTFRVQATGTERNGLHFDGSNDYVTINDVATSMDGVTTWSIESWIKADPTQTGNDHIMAVNTTGTGTIFLFRIDDGKLDFYDGSTAFEVGPDLRDNTWHHVAATYNNGTLNMYIDGVNYGTFAAGTVSFANNNRWSLGQEYDGSSKSEFFKGALNDVRIWNTVKTDQEIADHKYCEISSPETVTDLVAYYPFNQGVSNGTNTTITSLIDASSNAYHGVLTSFAKTGTTSNFVPAINVGVNCNSVSVTICDNNSYSIGGNTYTSSGVYIDTLNNTLGQDSIVYTDLALNYFQISQNIIMDTTVCDTIKEFATTNYTPFARFENTDNDWVEINDAVPNLVNTNRSVFLWMREADQISGSQDVLIGINTSGTSTVTNFGIATNEQLWINDGGSNRNSGVVVTDGQWHFVGYTYDEASNLTQFWVDGVAASSFSNGQSISTTSRISLGQEFDGSTPSNFYDGDMAEVTIWNEVLDASDVALLMATSAQSLHPKYSHLQAYYPMASDCNSNGLVLKDYSSNNYDGTVSANDVIITDTLANLPNHNAAPLYSKSWTRNGTSVSTLDSLFLTGAIQAGAYKLDLSLDNFNVSNTWNTTVNPACQGLFASVTVDSHISCNGLSDGSATVTGLNGTTPYTYAWNNGATTATITGLNAGAYTITITDGIGDTNSTTISITEPAVLDANPIITSNISTAGASDGISSASSTGGTTPYTYLWNTGAITTSISSLAAGSYTVTITDANGCVDNGSVNLIAPVAPAPGVIVISEINYNGPEVGTDTTEFIELHNTSSAPVNLLGCKFTSGVTYTFPNIAINAGGYLVIALDSVAINNVFGVSAYQWTGGGLSNGGEPIAIKDASNNMIDSLRYDDNLPWPDGPVDPDGGGSTIVLCDPNSDNTVGANWTISTSLVSGVIVNAKQVYGSPGAADAGCSTVLTASITNDSNVTCYGLANGGASASATSGTTPYTYAWSNSATTASITGVLAGTYTVTVTDANSDTSSTFVIITEPTALVASSSIDANTTCNGFADGGATASATGGTTPYTYAWSNSATTASITGVVAGTYTTTITDATGCTSTSSSTVTEPTALVASSVVDSNTTNGTSNGGATASATGGTASYTYTWSNGATTTSITGVSAGTYTTTITDASGCTDMTSSSITNTNGVSASVSNDSNVTCFGGSNGGATASAANGTAPFTYAWSNTATTASITGIVAGTYTVTITDNGSNTSTSSVTITEPAVLTAATVVDSNTTCNGFANGGATASATGGTAPYSYAWSNTATTASITGITAGTYSVTISDANGCTSISSATVTQPATLIAATIVDSNTVDNNPNGGATASATGGTMPYTYSWGNSATTASITGVMAGTYSVYITDAYGCSDNSNVTITNTFSLVATTVVDSNISCNGSADGGATASATGTNSPFTYAWSNSATTTSITGVTAGTYTVTVTDNSGGTETSSVTITQPAILVAASVIDSNISCNGFADGGATASATGGTTPYTYAWSNSATTASITGVIAGTYSVTIMDANGCISTSASTVTEPTLLVSATVVDSNTTCNGFANGGATASATGGTAPYTYAWSNSATTASITGVISGTYSVTIMDANGCTSTSASTVTEPTLLVSASVVDSNITCNGFANGGATASAIGGTAPYTYSWSNTATTASITGVIAGTYSVTIMDANGCTSASSVTVVEPVILLAASVVDSNITCNGFTDGGATASATGGTAPYTYAWNNSATTASITGVIAGTYSVTIMDANGCTSTSASTATEPTTLASASVVDSNITCNGFADGGTTASATGGTAPYTYAWSNSATTASITGVLAGTYTVTVMDANGCTSTSASTVTEPTLLVSASTVDSNITCNGFVDGGATASATGGTAPYTYVWSNSATTASITGVIAGTYSVTIMDANGCSSTSASTVTEPAILVSASIVDSNIACNGSADGGATASATGGTAPYTYAWSNSATNASITGVIAGTYSVTIMDANGCSSISSTTVTEPTILVSASVVDSNITCNGLANGGATASAAGGTSPYTYSWNNSATTASITGVIAGTYSVTIMDANGCTSTSASTVTEPTVLVATSVVDSNATCNGFANGGASSSATGGTAPYTYAWSNSAITASITGVTAGTYSVTITDANGCASASSTTITEPTVLVGSTVVDATISCNGLSDGGATASATGGTAPYAYSWSNSATTATITGVTAGTYMVTVLDANNCSSVATVTISEPNILLGNSHVDSNATCDGLPNGGASALPTGGTAPYTYLWSTSATTSSVAGLSAGSYAVTVTDANGCTSVESVIISSNNSTYSFISENACNSYNSPSGLYTWTASGSYQDTIPNLAGCDSIITIMLTIDENGSQQNITICKGESITVGTNTYTTTGNFTDVFTNGAGCDSTVITNLTVQQVDVTTTQTGFKLEANNTVASYQWINCDSNNAVIPGATNRVYLVTVSGNYAVIVNEGGCIDTSDCVLVDGLGINDFDENRDINVYPNPIGLNTSIVTIDVSNTSNYAIIIRDLTGKTIYLEEGLNNETNQIDVSRFAAGTFFIEIRSDNSSEYKRLIVM